MGVLDLWNQANQQLNQMNATPQEREYFTRMFLAKHAAAPEMQNQGTREFIISKVRGISDPDLQSSQNQVQAVGNPITAFTQSMNDEHVNNTPTGLGLRAVSKYTGNSNGEELQTSQPFYTDNPFADTGAFLGRMAGQVTDPTSAIPIARGAQVARGVEPGLAALWQAAKPAALSGGAVGGVVGGEANAAQQYIGGQPFDATSFAKSVGEGALMGGALASVHPILQAKGIIPQAAVNPHVQMMKDAGLSDQDIATVMNGGFKNGQPLVDQTGDTTTGPAQQQSAPQTPSQPMTPSVNLMPREQPVTPQEVQIPGVTGTNDNMFNLVSNGQSKPVKLVGTTGDGRVVVDDGVSRMTISPNLLEPANAFSPGNLVLRNSLLTPEQRMGQIESLPMGDTYINGDAMARDFIPGEANARPMTDIWGGNPPAAVHGISNPLPEDVRGTVNNETQNGYDAASREAQRIASVRSALREAGPWIDSASPGVPVDAISPDALPQAAPRSVVPDALAQKLQAATAARLGDAIDRTVPASVPEPLPVDQSPVTADVASPGAVQPAAIDPRRFSNPGVDGVGRRVQAVQKSADAAAMDRLSQVGSGTSDAASQGGILSGAVADTIESMVRDGHSWGSIVDGLQQMGIPDHVTLAATQELERRNGGAIPTGDSSQAAPQAVPEAAPTSRRAQIEAQRAAAKSEVPQSREATKSTQEEQGSVPAVREYQHNYVTDPTQINEKTWYHGTGTPDLTPDTLSTNMTKVDGLFGHGVYLTDSPKIAEGYANAGRNRRGTPTVYEAKVNTSKVLDLDKQMPKGAQDEFVRAGNAIDPSVGEAVKGAVAKGENGQGIYKAFSEAIRDYSQGEQVPTSEFEDVFQHLSGNLRDLGYDAYTHTGGSRTGNEPHQVLIMLDPNDEFRAQGQPMRENGRVTQFNPRQEPVPPREARPSAKTATGAADAVGATTANDYIKARDFVENHIPPEGAGPSGATHAANINLSTISDEASMQRVFEDLANHHAIQMNEAKRGTQTWQQSRDKATQMLADELGMSAEKLLQMKKGTALNAEEMLAAKDIVSTSYKQNVEPAFKRIQDGDNSDAAKLEAVKAVQLHVALMSKSAGAASEAARALNIVKKIGEVNSHSARQVKDLLGLLGGGDTVENLANALSNAGPQVTNRVLRNVNRKTWADMAGEYIVNGFLSSPTTQLGLSLSNATNVASKLAESLVAATIGETRKALTGRRAGLTLGEVQQQAYGILQGVREGWAMAKLSALSGESEFNRARQLDGVGGTFHDFSPAIPGKVGQAIRIPSHGIVAQDDFWKGVTYRMELNGLAYREAQRAVGAGEIPASQMAQHMQDLMTDPTEAMMEAATHEARYRTFQDKLGTGFFGIEKLASALNRFKSQQTQAQLALQASSNPIARGAESAISGATNVLMSLLVPFVKLPVKITTMAAEHSPLALFTPEFYQKTLLSGEGATRDLALSKVIVGSSLGALFYSLAAGHFGNNIKVIGSAPSDPTEKRTFRQMGYQPNSLYLNGTSYALDRLGPFGMIAGMASDVANAVNNPDKAHASQDVLSRSAVALVKSIFSNFGEATFWQGMHEFTEALSDPDKNFDRFIATLTTSAIPFSAGVSHTAMALDSTVRNTKAATLGDTVERTLASRLPFLSQSVPPQLSATGQPLQRSQTGVEALVNPVKRQDVTQDPVVTELDRLKMNMPQPEQKITAFRKHSVQLTDQEYQDYRQIYGNNVQQRLGDTVTSPYYTDPSNGMTDDQKRFRLQRILHTVEEASRNQFLQQNPQVRDRARTEASTVR